jgi:hypothetical protein
MKRLSLFSKSVIFLLVILLVGCPVMETYSAFKTDYVTAKVIAVEDQQKIQKSGTEYRYLVITDKETFVCEKSYLKWHFDASNTFYRIKKDSTYHFKVQGIGKGVLTDYRNILLVTPAEPRE